MQKIQILNTINSNQNSGLQFSHKLTKDVIAGVTDKNDTIGYVLSGGDNSQLSVTSQTIAPYINLNKERNCILITGNSGNGKTVIASILIEEYHKHYPTDNVLFISGNNKEDDISLSPLRYLQQLEIEDINDAKAEDFAESIILIDDCDYHKSNKIIFAFLNDIVERGRKFNISVIFISHTNSKITSSVVYRDFDQYITFADNLSNNRVIEATLKINPQLIQQIKHQKPSYICINKSYRTIVTNKFVVKY